MTKESIPDLRSVPDVWSELVTISPLPENKATYLAMFLTSSTP